MRKKAKHSKFKNSGVLFELLTRQITADILAGRDESFTKNLMFKYFNESTALGKEFQLYNFIVSQSSKNVESADRILNVVLQTRSKLNERELNSEKYNLIKEIKGKFNIDEFLKNKIPNYKLYASVYKLFENQGSEEVKFDVEEILEARECVVESLTKERKGDEQALDVYSSQPAEVKLLAYKFLIENFNKKYSSLLPSQKVLLKEYITNVSNTNRFTEFVNKEYKRVADLLKERSILVKHDVIKIKLNETIAQLSNKTLTGVVKESQLTALLSAYELIEELNKLADEKAS
tara:strand:+ start:342 stop:1214 length:873 start_codon:yes stop_codon:yes gene_type:complete